MSLQIRQFPWDSQGWCSARVSDCLPGAVGYNQTVAPAETEPKAAHDHSHTAASLDWYFRLPGGHDHHVSCLLHSCEQFPTPNISMLYFVLNRTNSKGDCWHRVELCTLQSNLMYGWKLYSYRTLLDAAQTMMSLQLGIFNYEEVCMKLLRMYHSN